MLFSSFAVLYKHSQKMQDHYQRGIQLKLHPQYLLGTTFSNNFCLMSWYEGQYKIKQISFSTSFSSQYSQIPSSSGTPVDS